jgi:hypothetical protein
LSNGTFQIAGVQIDTASAGQASLGPFALPFGAVSDIQTVLVNTTATIAVPAFSFGVCVIPPIGNTTPSLEWSTVSYANAAGNHIAPGSPSIWEFDGSNFPSNLYLVSGGSVNVVVQFI